MYLIEILSVSGYEKTEQLKENTKKALQELGLHTRIAEVTEINALMAADIKGIPALRINGKVVLQRLVPSVEILKTIFKSTELYPRAELLGKNEVFNINR